MRRLYISIWAIKLLVLFVLLFCYTAFQLGKKVVHDTRTSSFQPHMADYLKQPEHPPDRKRKEPLRGKVLPINRDTRTVDTAYEVLPSDMRPANPEEVRAVVWLSYVYDDKTSSWTCRATLIDRTNSTVIAEGVINGPRRPRSDGDTIDMSREVVSWLCLLRQRT